VGFDSTNAEGNNDHFDWLVHFNLDLLSIFLKIVDYYQLTNVQTERYINVKH
jgi:hypothetical protein